MSIFIISHHLLIYNNLFLSVKMRCLSLVNVAYHRLWSVVGNCVSICMMKFGHHSNVSLRRSQMCQTEKKTKFVTYAVHESVIFACTNYERLTLDLRHDKLQRTSIAFTYFISTEMGFYPTARVAQDRH